MSLADDRDLTADEIKQLIASNSRAIMANSEAIAETNRTMTEGFTRLENNVNATSEAVFQLASLMQRFFQNQIDTNTQVEGRLNRLDPQN
jgi:hypothetical protein